MRAIRIRAAAAMLAAVFVTAGRVAAQGTAADYDRANGLRAKYEALAANIPGPVGWIGSTTRFWYRNVDRGKVEFIMFDAALRQKRPAFDHEKLAAGLSKATGVSYGATRLPFTTIAFSADESTLEVTAGGMALTCDLGDYTSRKSERRPPPHGPPT